MKCLVTKYKDSVSNTDLAKLNTLMAYGIEGVEGRSIKLSSLNRTFKATVVSGTSPFAGGADSLTFVNNTNISGGNYTLDITPLYSISEICLYGSVKINLTRDILEHLDINDLQNIIINDTGNIVDENVKIGRLNGNSLNILRIGTLTQVSGLIEDLNNGISLTEIQIPSTVKGNINNWANSIYTRRDFSSKPNCAITASIDPHVFYYNGTTNVRLRTNTPYYIVFKQGGYEIHLNTASGELLYDSLA